MIISKKLQTDEAITESALTTVLGMGRTPIREALTLLSKDGLIDLIPGRGAFLKKFRYEDLIYIYQIREVLDPLAAKQAIGRLDLIELKKIKDKYFYSEQLDWATGQHFSRELHALIYKSSANPYLIELFENFNGRIDMSRHLLWDIWSKAGTEDIIFRRNHEHVQIIQALEERDFETAEKISAEHIKNGIHDLLRAMNITEE